MIQGKNLRKFLSRIGLDDFLLALILVIILAYFWPQPGISEGPFSISNLANYGVSGIFFFYGLRLSPEKLKSGLSNWKLHVLIQLSTFLIFPLVVIAFYPVFKGGSQELLWMGTFYLAALPSTVSSSVVMVSIAGGNIPAAIFNASISSLIGVFITPVWMGLFLSNSADFDIWMVFGKLILQVLFPVFIGVALYSKLGGIAEQYKKQLKYFDQLIILLIVYSSFSESFAKKMFSIFDIGDIFVLGVVMLILFFFIYGVIYLTCGILNFPKPDKITALFCGSKKSLVQGTVMSKVLFGASNSIGVILLPIMLYHALQLLVVSIIAQEMGGKARIIVKG